MKRKLKSVLALLLALSMALSLLCGAVWAAESDESSTSDASVQTEEAAETAENDAQTSAPEEEPPAQEAQEETPTKEEEPPAQEAQEEAPAKEEELEAQAPTSYYPTNLVVTNTLNTINLKWTSPSIPGGLKNERLVIEGREYFGSGSYGSWVEVRSSLLSNDRGVSTAQSGEGYWKDLKLVTRHQYQFRVYYRSNDGDPSTYATSETVTYCNKDQELAILKEKVNEAKIGQGETFTYGNTLTIVRPLYTVNLTFLGGDSDGNFNFHADVTSNYADNGYVESDSRYVRGLEFRLDGIYYLKRSSGEPVYHSLSSGTSADFSVESEDMAFGCNYVQLRLDASDYSAFGLPEEYLSETPMYLSIRVSRVPMDTGSALTDKSSMTLRTYNWTGGSVKTYDDKLPGMGKNVTESGLYVWYRKKGGSWSKKKTFKSGKAVKIKDLSANTVYEWKAQYYLKSVDKQTGDTKTLTSDESDVFKVRTADKNKPAVKSYKISGLKYVKHHTEGKYVSTSNGLKWQEPMTWYTTDYTMKITFKKVPSGVYGYWLNKGTNASDSLVKVKGKTITIKCSTSGKSKGKKTSVYLESCTNSNGTGRSPALKYTYKIK